MLELIDRRYHRTPYPSSILAVHIKYKLDRIIHIGHGFTQFLLDSIQKT